MGARQASLFSAGAAGQTAIGLAHLNDQDTIRTTDRLLARAVRAALHGEPLPAWECPQNHTTDALAQIFLARAEFHGVVVILADALRDSEQSSRGWADWPQPVTASLRDAARRAALTEQIEVTAIRRLIDGLDESGIALVLLKGMALAYLAYPSATMRPRGDTDMLIRATDLGATREHLASSGWQRVSSPHTRQLQESWRFECALGIVAELDLHWQPSERPVLQKLLREEDFWQGRTAMPRLSPHASAPDALRLLVHGAVNQLWHQVRGVHVAGSRVVDSQRLIWSVDHHFITAGFGEAQWGELIAFCQECDAGAIVAAALTQAQRDIGLALPDGLLTALKPASGRSATYEYITGFDEMANALDDLRAARGLADKAKILRHIALVPRDQLEQRYPQSRHWPTSLLHLRRLAGAAARLIGLRPRGPAYHLAAAQARRDAASGD